MAFIDYSVANVALPVLQTELGANMAQAQWVVEIYILFVASLIGSLFLKRAWIFGAALLGLYFLADLLYWWLVFYRIRCPQCGHNPTKRKDGKSASRRYLEGKFRKMTECPECKFQGATGK